MHRASESAVISRQDSGVGPAPWLGRWGVACLALITAVQAGCGKEGSGDSRFPQRPIKVIVPFAAGGGSDTFARIVDSAVKQQDLLPQPLVVINVPGAGGTIGSRRVKNARPDGYTVLLLHEGILTAKHSGQASYGPEAFASVAGTGEATQVIATVEQSPHRDLRSLMKAASSRPGEVIFSANIGAPSHFAGLMLEAEQPGAEFRYTQTGGGAKRFAALKGGHVDVSAFSIAEYSQFKSAGIRALALLGPERKPDVPEVPTARAQGFDVISQNMQFWWAPKGTPAERVELIAEAVCAAVESPPVRQRLREMKIDPVTIRGDALAGELRRRGDRIASVGPTQEVQLPDFPAITFAAVLGLAAVALLRGRFRGSLRGAPAAASEPAAKVSLAAIAAWTVLYVLSMQAGWLRFVPATLLYALLTGGTLLARAVLADRAATADRASLPRAALMLVVVAGVMSFAVHHLFTEVLVVDLP